MNPRKLSKKKFQDMQSKLFPLQCESNYWEKYVSETNPNKVKEPNNMVF